MGGKANGGKVHELTDLIVEEVSIVDRPANRRPFLLVKNEGGMGDKGTEITTTENGELTAGGTINDTIDDASEWAGIEKAVWSTAFVNDLPDSSFLYIAPGGKKDAQGKTTPRSLRMFPVRDASGKVDAPHVRNALSRVSQAKIPDDVKAKVRAAAEKLLASITKSRDELVADIEKRLAVPADIRSEAFKMMGDVMRRIDIAMSTLSMAETDHTNAGDSPIMKVLGDELAELATVVEACATRFSGKSATKKNDVPTTTPAPSTIETSLDALLANVTAQRDELAKRGAKMARGRLDQFKQGLTILRSILEELEGAEKGKPAGAPEGDARGKTAKSEGGDRVDVAKRLADLEAENAELRKSVGDLTDAGARATETIRKQAAELKKFRDMPGSSNGLHVEGSGSGAPVRKSSSDRVHWSLDEAAAAKREAEETRAEG